MSRIGVGAVGELYKAMDESRGTFVALRTLRDVSRAASDSLQQDFLALKAVRIYADQLRLDQARAAGTGPDVLDVIAPVLVG